jgi:predicted TIM-barrel fold metal-dependent hydrolase
VIIDIHAHYFPHEYLDRIDRYKGTQATTFIRRRNRLSQSPADLQAQLRLMDRAHIDLQVLSVSNHFPYFAGEVDAVSMARLANDLYADVVRQYPQRFAAFACTPLPHMQPALDEMSRALDQLGMIGVTAGTTVLGTSIADPAFDAFWAELNRRKSVLFLHPVGASAGSQMIEASKLTWPIGAPLEDTVCMLQLMQAEVTQRFPNVKVVLPHLGGFAPFLMARLDELQDRFLSISAPAPSVQAKSFWYDTVNAHPWALRCTRETVGTDRLLMGTDYPFWVDEAFLLAVDYLSQAELPAQAVDLILSGNAQALLGLGSSLF